MKKITILFFLLFFGTMFTNKTIAVTPSEFYFSIIEQVASNLNSHDAAALAANFDNSLEITIFDKESNYSKAQAEVVVRDFFSKSAPTGFKLNHQGTSPDGSMYGIGVLNCSLGAIRVYYFAKQKKGRFLIQELRFEK
jgi:hypothetical protein